MFEKEKGTESCRDGQAFSDFGFYLEMPGHFQGSREKWHDPIYFVKRWSRMLCWELPTEVKSRSRAYSLKRSNWLLASPYPFRDSFSGYQCQPEQITTFLGAYMFLLIQREIGSKKFSLSFQLWKYVNHQSAHFYKRQFFPVLNKVLMILKIIV